MLSITVALPVKAIHIARRMSSSVLSFRILQYHSKLIIHDSEFFPSNFGISNLICLHGLSVYTGAAGACPGGVIAEAAAGAMGACIGGVGVAAELAAGAYSS